MNIKRVIEHFHSAWHEVSGSWKDEMSERFRLSVIAESSSILERIDNACEQLEKETNAVYSKLNQLEDR
jgi:hypothetical protein